MRGDLIVPGDPGYDDARSVYNGMIDKHPAAIARCRDIADVISCVGFARRHGAEIAVRGGGHSGAGLGVADGALVIDLSLLRSTTVDPARRTVRADAGCTWGDVDHATVQFGMATPSGFIGSTGVAGLTLGGGIGYLSRRFGLTVDSLLSADVLLAPATLRDRQRRRPPRSVLGAARRRRELRHRHLVHVPLPRHRRARHDHRRPGPVRLRRHRRGDALVSGAAAIAARRAERLDRPDHHPARGAVPRRAVGPQGMRHRLVLHRSARPGRGSVRGCQDLWLAAAGGRAGDAVRRAAERVRRPVPGRAPMVASSRVSTRTRPTPASSRNGPGTTGRSCTRPRPAARISTS